MSEADCDLGIEQSSGQVLDTEALIGDVVCLGGMVASVRFVLLSVVLALLNGLIVGGNLMVIVAVLVYSKLRENLTNRFILSLALSDLLLGAAVLPFSSVNMTLDKHWLFGATYCTIWMAVDVWLCTASILNLVAISYERYLAVRKPMAYARQMTPRRVHVVIVSVWLLAFLICLPSLFQGGEHGPPPRGANESSAATRGNASFATGWACVVRQQCTIAESSLFYVLYSFSFSFLIPAVLMVAMYAKIYETARSAAQGMQSGHIVARGPGGGQTVTMRVHCGKRDSTVGLLALTAIGGVARHALGANGTTPEPPAAPSPSTSRPSLTPTLVSKPTTTSRQSSTPTATPTPTLRPPLTPTLTSSCRVAGPAKPNRMKQMSVRQSPSACGMLVVAVPETDGLAAANPAATTGAGVPAPAATGGGGNLAPPGSTSLRRHTVVSVGNTDSRIETHEEQLRRLKQLEQACGALAPRRAARPAKQRETKAAKICFVLVFGFLAMWMPFFVAYVITPFCADCLPAAVWDVFFYLGYLNSAVNVVVYAAFSRDFRNAFIGLLTGSMLRERRRRQELVRKQFATRALMDASARLQGHVGQGCAPQPNHALVNVTVT